MIKRTPSALRIQILVAFAAGEARPYAVVQQMIKDTAGSLIIRERHVYTAIPDLVKAELIEPGLAEGTYHLTDFGKRILQWELQRLQQITQLLRKRLRSTGFTSEP